MPRSLSFLFGLGLCMACHESATVDATLLQDPPALAAVADPAPKAPPQEAPTIAARLPALAGDAAALAELAARGRERCPDELLPRGIRAETELGVQVADARADRRSILPLDLKQALGSEPPDVSRPRYAAELLISVYEAPHHFRRLNAPRSEWAAGRLQGRLLVWDLESQRVVCQAPLTVRGDATAAPLRRRLRESTRQQLESKLYGRARTEMDKTLAGVSSVFRLSPKRKATEPTRGS